MKHRIFIAINLPEKLKNELKLFQEKWSEFPARWVKPENLHITLIFLGYLSNSEILEALKISREVALRHQPFLINLKKIIYVPLKKPARMIWVEGEKSKELGNLQKDLETSLLNSSIRKLETENRPYTPHITLARIKQWQFRQIEPEERPEINEDIDLSFEVKSIEMMESHLKRSGPEYTILETIPLSKFSR